MENRQRRLFVQNVLKLKSKGKSKLEADLQQEFLQEKSRTRQTRKTPFQVLFLAPTPQVLGFHFILSFLLCMSRCFFFCVVGQENKKEKLNKLGSSISRLQNTNQIFCINMRTVVASAGQFSLFRILLACEGSMSGHHRRLVHAQKRSTAINYTLGKVLEKTYTEIVIS